MPQRSMQMLADGAHIIMYVFYDLHARQQMAMSLDLLLIHDTPPSCYKHIYLAEVNSQWPLIS